MNFGDVRVSHSSDDVTLRSDCSKSPTCPRNKICQPSRRNIVVGARSVKKVEREVFRRSAARESEVKQIIRSKRREQRRLIIVGVCVTGCNLRETEIERPKRRSEEEERPRTAENCIERNRIKLRSLAIQRR